MSTIRTIAKNFSFLILAKMITLSLGLVVTCFIARSIGNVDFGKLGFAQSFTGLLIIFADMGLGAVTIREIARHRELASKYLGNIFFIKLILSGITMSLLVLIINLMHKPPDTKFAVYIVGIYSVFNSFSDFMRAIFKAFEKMEYESYLDIGKSIVISGIILVILFLGHGLIAIVLVYLFIDFVNLLVSLIVTAKKFAIPDLKIDLQFGRKIISLAFPFLWTASIGTVYHQIDIVMLSIIKGEAAVGWYNAACKLIYTLVVIPDTFCHALFPVMSRLYLSSEKGLLLTMEKSAKYLFIIGLPICIGTVLLADRIILLLYGKDYIPSILAMQFLALYLPLRFINHITGYTLSSINKEPLRALSATIAALTNIVLNFILIPTYSIAGAAIATAITEIVLFAFYDYFVAKNFYRLKLIPIFTKPLLACILMGIFVYYLRELNLVLLIFSAAFIYLASLYFIKGFDSMDKAIFRKLINGLPIQESQNG